MTVAGGFGEVLCCLYHCVCWDADAADALVDESIYSSFPVSNHYAILLFINSKFMPGRVSAAALLGRT